MPTQFERDLESFRQRAEEDKADHLRAIAAARKDRAFPSVTGSEAADQIDEAMLRQGRTQQQSEPPPPPFVRVEGESNYQGQG